MDDDDIVTRLREWEELKEYDRKDAADEIERLRAENDELHDDLTRLLQEVGRLRAAGDKLAQGVLDEHQPFPNDEHIVLWWLVVNWEEARRG